MCLRYVGATSAMNIAEQTPKGTQITIAPKSNVKRTKQQRDHPEFRRLRYRQPAFAEQKIQRAVHAEK